ncbi:hypothetical protein ACET3X_007015 [Alternaria dauci]|uniref:F-box domain-containing protein n=1 Tax=Alternaria dauci TaxID=48095 RepID=A0ABR3UHX3_9PLEO
MTNQSGFLKILQRGFSGLPLELFLNVLDQLVGTHDGQQQPVAYEPSSIVTKTLRALTLVSRQTYLVATKYLYSYCLYLDSCTTFARFCRTLGLDLGHHPQALEYGEAGRNDELFAEARVLQNITSVFVSPSEVRRLIEGNYTPLVRLPQIIDLCDSIGLTLKRLALDLSPTLATPREIEQIRPHVTESNVFVRMPHLEELIISYDVLNYFRHPPPNLKRLAITAQELTDLEVAFCLKIPSLQMLAMMRPVNLEAKAIDIIFTSYNGKSLDAILVDVNSNHRTPEGTRSWKEIDTVRIWEVDVPVSFYGDEDDTTLCDNWIWTHGVKGTLWSQEKRRMASWQEIQRRLAGPVHTIMEV